MLAGHLLDLVAVLAALVGLAQVELRGRVGRAPRGQPKLDLVAEQVREVNPKPTLAGDAPVGAAPLRAAPPVAEGVALRS